MSPSTRGAARVLVPALAASAFAGTALAQQFNFDIATIPGTARWTEGVEAADVDNDGDYDLFFADGEGFSSAGTQRQNTLVINQLEIAAGQFSDQSVARLGVHVSNAKMASAADIDNDGWVDCLFANAFNTDLPFLYHNRGAGNPGFFDEEGVARGLTEILSSASSNFGDLDNDGDLDLILCDSGASFLGGVGDRPRLYFNDGAGNFTLDVPALNAPIKAAHMDVLFVDINNDWSLDFFGTNRATNAGGNHYLMLNDGLGNFTDVSSLIPATSASVYEADLGDFDADTDIDMFFVSSNGFAEGAVRNNLVENGGTLNFTKGPTFGTGDDNEIAMFDYDVDGDLDAVIGALGQASEKMARNNGVGGFTLVNGVFEAISDSTLDVEVVDLDNDGRYDVVSAQGESSSGTWANKVYFNNGPIDTLPPVVQRQEALSNPSQTGPWVLRAQIQDQVSEDGQTYVTAVADYVVKTAGGDLPGSVAGFDMNGGIFRFALTDTSGGAGTELCYTLSFTDDAGNVTTTSEVCVDLPGCGYFVYGTGLGGANTLGLAGSGPLPDVGGSATLVTTNLQSATVFVGLSVAPINLPIFGGTLLVSPVPFLNLFPTGAVAGTANFLSPIPNDPVLGGVELYFQSFEFDGGQPQGIGFSNGLRLKICP
jgi:hypothetical protein